LPPRAAAAAAFASASRFSIDLSVRPRPRHIVVSCRRRRALGRRGVSACHTSYCAVTACEVSDRCPVPAVNLSRSA
jgi:hypothetical protein